MSKKVERALKKFPAVLALSGGNVSEACRKLKISRSTYQRLYETDKEFQVACNDVREELVDFGESKLLQLVKEGNVQAVMFFLKTQGKHRGYIERQEVDQRVQDVRILIKE